MEVVQFNSPDLSQRQFNELYKSLRRDLNLIRAKPPKQTRNSWLSFRRWEEFRTLVEQKRFGPSSLTCGTTATRYRCAEFDRALLDFKIGLADDGTPTFRVQLGCGFAIFRPD